MFNAPHTSTVISRHLLPRNSVCAVKPQCIPQNKTWMMSQPSAQYYKAMHVNGANNHYYTYIHRQRFCVRSRVKDSSKQDVWTTSLSNSIQHHVLLTRIKTYITTNPPLVSHLSHLFHYKFGSTSCLVLLSPWAGLKVFWDALKVFWAGLKVFWDSLKVFSDGLKDVKHQPQFLFSFWLFIAFCPSNT